MTFKKQGCKMKVKMLQLK